MKKIVDNFLQISNFLFLNEENRLAEDEFYFLQVLVRRKDGNKVSGNNKNRLVKFYRVRTADELMSFKDEIVALCRVTNGRAYINPTPRNYKNVANLVLEDTARTFISQNYAGLPSMYPTACGKSYVKEKRFYIVDLDNVDIDDPNSTKVYRDYINEECNGEVKALVPTKSGCHLICKKFNTKKFNDKFPCIDVHKNNPTLLYFETRD